jgi:hypothetical protein
VLVAHQLHTSRHNTSTHHDEQIEVCRSSVLFAVFVAVCIFSAQKRIGITSSNSSIRTVPSTNLFWTFSQWYYCLAPPSRTSLSKAPFFSQYLKSENLPETLTRDSAYRKLLDHSSMRVEPRFPYRTSPSSSSSSSTQSDNSKHPFFSPKPRRSLLGAYQDLKQSISKVFEVRPQNGSSLINKPLPLLASMYVHSLNQHG